MDVNPVARDEEIRKRLQSVLDATSWFEDPRVRVEQGVVFLNGPVESEELKKWAGDLARNTQDVVAVANRMEVALPSIGIFSPRGPACRCYGEISFVRYRFLFLGC